MANVLTVREAVLQAKSEGYPITEYSLRGWIKSGALPVRTTGRKILVFYPNLVRFLQCEDGSDNTVQSESLPKIRRLEV